MTDPRSDLLFAEDLQTIADELLELEGSGEEARAAGQRLAGRMERRITELLETRPDGVDHALARPAWVTAELLREAAEDWPTEGAVTEEHLWEVRALLLAALVPTLDEESLGLPRMGRWSSWHEAPEADEEDSSTFSSRAGILSFAGFVDEPDDERTRERRERLLAASRLTVRQLRRHVRDVPAAPPPAPEPVASAEKPSEAAIRPGRGGGPDQVEWDGLTPESLETLWAVYELGARPRSRVEVAVKEVAGHLLGPAVDDRARKRVGKRLQRLRKRGLLIKGIPGFRLSQRGEAAVLKSKKRRRV